MATTAARAPILRQKTRPKDEPYSWEEVCQLEWETIKKRRALRQKVAAPLAVPADTVGLSFSGGGIRSATLNLGVLQGLAHCDVLRNIDYVSSVSGGSYINAWLNAWIARRGFAEVNQVLKSTDEDYRSRSENQRPIARLREYCSYLTPRGGSFSGDTWTAVGMYVVKLLPNMLFVISLVALLLTIPCLVAAGYKWQSGANSWLATEVVLLTLSVASLTLASLTGYRELSENDSAASKSANRRATLVATALFIPSLCAGLGAGMLIQRATSPLPEYPIFVSVAVGLIFFAGFLGLARKGSGRGDVWSVLVGPLFGAALAGIVWFAVLSIVDKKTPTGESLKNQADLLFPVLFALILVVAVAFCAALTPFRDTTREWVYRFLGRTLLFALTWCVLYFVPVSLPHALSELVHEVHLGSDKSSPEPTKVVGVLTWLVTVLAGVAAAYSEQTKGRPKAKAQFWSNRLRRKPESKTSGLELLARAAPVVAVTGIFALEAVLLGREIVDSPRSALLCLAVSGFVVLAVFTRYDVNWSSVASFYRNRLIACYLKSTQPTDAAAQAGEFKNGDLAVSNLICKDSQTSDFNAGPYPIINASLNVTRGGDLDLQKRKAISFVFTPLFAGYNTYKEADEKRGLKNAGYRPSESYAHSSDSRPLTLGTVMAISGAAASPNEGYHTSPSVAVLLTMFNIRLGWWIGNPRHSVAWKSQGPPNSLWHLASEVVGSANDEQDYVYLSDGGHFENLGLYELVRRRVDLALICDVSMDPHYTFDNLMNAIELCHVDFGATIKIDTDPLLPRSSTCASYCSSHFTVGTIEYSGGKKGVLVLLKSGVLASDPIAVRDYDRKSQPFPHEPTINQWFDQKQFEAYRQLGYASILSLESALKCNVILPGITDKVESDRLKEVVCRGLGVSHGN